MFDNHSYNIHDHDEEAEEAEIAEQIMKDPLDPDESETGTDDDDNSARQKFPFFWNEKSNQIIN